MQNCSEAWYRRDIHDAQRMNPKDLADLLSFFIEARMSNCQLSHEISQHLLDEFAPPFC